MKDEKDPTEREKAHRTEREQPHPTVAESFAGDDSEPIVQVRAADVWTDFVRESGEKREPDNPRQNGTVPLLDDMTGIRQWE